MAGGRLTTEKPDKPDVRHDREGLTGWRLRLHEVVFETTTPAGRRFDLILAFLIIASVVCVSLESVASIDAKWHRELRAIEWVFTILFSIEYWLRIASVRHPLRYATSFYGIIDFVAILPTWLSFFFPGLQGLISIRLLRLLRLFRVFKLFSFVAEAETLSRAIYASRRKITVFLLTVLALVTILGATMYFVEGPEHGYTSIPRGMYWAIVTLTTVGYGDIAPKTALGQTIASGVMILGYAILAVPTGIISAELARSPQFLVSRACDGCGLDAHEADSKFCRRCGEKL